MADTEINGLTGIGTLDVLDVVHVNDVGSSNVSRKATMQQIIDLKEDTAILEAPGSMNLTSIGTTGGVIRDTDSKTTVHQLGATVIVRAGTLRNFYLVVSTNNQTVNDGEYSIYKNGVVTSLVLTLTNGVTGVFSDTSNTVSVVAGDYISFVARSNPAPTGTITISRGTVEILYS